MGFWGISNIPKLPSSLSSTVSHSEFYKSRSLIDLTHFFSSLNVSQTHKYKTSRLTGIQYLTSPSKTAILFLLVCLQHFFVCLYTFGPVYLWVWVKIPTQYKLMMWIGPNPLEIWWTNLELIQMASPGNQRNYCRLRNPLIKYLIIVITLVRIWI